MNWFQRHLNWTAFVMAVASFCFLAFFVIFSHGFNVLFYPSLFELGFLRLLLVSIIVTGCLFLSAVGYGWILYRKQRSPAFLIFFFPSLVSIIMCLVIRPPIDMLEISPYISYEIINTPYISVAITCNFIFLLLGWLLLLTLDNRSLLPASEYNKNGRAVGTFKPPFLNNVYSSSKKLIYAISCITGIVIITSIFSFFFYRYGYVSTNEPRVPEWSYMPDFSLEYPASYFRPVYMEYMEEYKNEPIIALELWFCSAFINVDQPFIFVRFYDQVSSFKILETFGSYRDWVKSFRFSTQEEYEQQLIETDTIISGIQAHQVISIITSPHEWLSGTEIHAYFELNDCLWLISWTFDEITIQPPPNFVHLLGTFTVHE
jgi:hypothetical protein